MNKNTFKTKKIVFCAMAIALALITSTITKISFPAGGSITLFSMLIICLTGWWYGPFTGIFTGTVYGILQFLMQPYFITPLQFLLDYPLAFACLGFAGFFKDKPKGLIYGYIISVFGRFVCHEISGLIFYTEYVDTSSGNLMAVLSSTAYNLGYLVPEMAATLILISIPAVSKMLNRIKQQACSNSIAG